MFTPRLCALYPAIKEHAEIIFVSSDRSEPDFNNYFSSMPFLAVPYSAPGIKQALSTRYAQPGSGADRAISATSSLPLRPTRPCQLRR
jgi:nucleoredoxin